MRARDEVGSLALKLNASAPGFGTVVCLLAVAEAEAEAEKGTHALASNLGGSNSSSSSSNTRSSSSSTGSVGAEGSGFGGAAVSSGRSTGLHEWAITDRRASEGSLPTSLTMAAAQMGVDLEGERQKGERAEENERAEILARIVGEWEAREERSRQKDIGAPVADGHGWCTPMEVRWDLSLRREIPQTSLRPAHAYLCFSPPAYPLLPSLSLSIPAKEPAHSSSLPGPQHHTPK